MKEITKTFELGGRKLTLQTGKLANQADSAVLAQYGETVVLATVVAAPLKQDLGYFPLTVEYQERLYAGGRIKGSRWIKREGRPTDEEILSARLIDRSIRPLFPEGYKKEVQVIVMVLSVDMENDPKMVGAMAVSAALASSPIPWSGPVGTLTVGLKDGKYFTNPVEKETGYSELDLVVSGTRDAVVMIEAGAKEVSESAIADGIEYAQDEAKKLIGFIDEFAKAIGRKKEDFKALKNDADLVKKVKKLISDRLDNLISELAVHEGGDVAMMEIEKAIASELETEDPVIVIAIFHDLLRARAREIILDGKHLDGRKHKEIRKILAETAILPRTHGSAIFQRGQTQALTVATLGSASMGQLLESAEGEETKRYIHHYSMPPYATGEVGRVGNPSRREIGHGALAERALMPVIPSEDKFPYTIRLVSEVMSSNGSTSMASTCGSTLALMDAGVPILSPVSGIAMGVVIESSKKYAILSDIVGLEDHMGDMDFKVAGTASGITALQLDVKTLSLTGEILREALGQAKGAREEIMDIMLKAIPAPREKVSTYAPKVVVVKVPVEMIGEVIGPGGRVIKKIIADTGAEVEMHDDGTINITGLTEESVQKAKATVEGIVKQVQAGEIYEGIVQRIQPFGAFVEILPGKEGLVHVSDMSDGFVGNPEEVVHLGDKVQVRVKEIDNLGRINLSMRMDPSTDKPRERAPRSGGFGQDRDRGRRSGGRSFSGGNRGGGRSGQGGPHFPASRFVDTTSQPKKRFGRQ